MDDLGNKDPESRVAETEVHLSKVNYSARVKYSLDGSGILCMAVPPRRRGGGGNKGTTTLSGGGGGRFLCWKDFFVFVLLEPDYSFISLFA